VKPIAALLAAAGVLLLFGCGGNSNDDSASSLSRAEFTKKVNQMCEEEKKDRTKAEEAKQKELGVEPGEFVTPAEQAKIVAVSIPFYEKVTRRIAELIPSDQEDKTSALIREREKVAELVRGGGPSQPALGAIFKANKAAIRYGLSECSI